MARTAFKVEVLTPEGEVFNDEVEMVSTRTTVGSIGILANHQPLLGMLEPTDGRLLVWRKPVENSTYKLLFAEKRMGTSNDFRR